MNNYEYVYIYMYIYNINIYIYMRKLSRRHDTPDLMRQNFEIKGILDST